MPESGAPPAAAVTVPVMVPTRSSEALMFGVVTPAVTFTGVAPLAEDCPLYHCSEIVVRVAAPGVRSEGDRVRAGRQTADGVGAVRRGGRLAGATLVTVFDRVDADPRERRRGGCVDHRSRDQAGRVCARRRGRGGHNPHRGQPEGERAREDKAHQRLSGKPERADSAAWTNHQPSPSADSPAPAPGHHSTVIFGIPGGGRRIRGPRLSDSRTLRYAPPSTAAGVGPASCRSSSGHATLAVIRADRKDETPRTPWAPSQFRGQNASLTRSAMTSRPHRTTTQGGTGERGSGHPTRSSLDRRSEVGRIAALGRTN